MSRLTVTFTYNNSSGTFTAEDADGHTFIVSRQHIGGNLAEMLQDFALSVDSHDDEKGLRPWLRAPHQRASSYVYDEAQVKKYDSRGRPKLSLEDLELDLEDMECD